MARIVAGEQRRYIHVQSEKVAYDILVFGAVQTPERIGAARVGFGGGNPIERCFERRYNRVVTLLIRARHAVRGHGARPKLTHHLFPDLRMFGNILSVDGSERKSTCLQAVAMASDAILVSESRLRLGPLLRSADGDETDCESRECHNT